VDEGIRRLAQAGHKLALLTNKQGKSSRAIMRHFGLDGFFSAIVGGGDAAHLKPDPSGVFQCLEAAAMKASNAWMIGDHYTDLAVAQNAGIKSAFVQYGFGEERGYEPDLYFASFPELVGYFVGR
jgi:phosphoglycolate phosphatase